MKEGDTLRSRAEEGGQEKLRAKPPVYTPLAGSPRNPLPHAVVSALTALIDFLPDVPSEQRVELRNVRSRLCRLYRIDDPQMPANSSELAWEEKPDEEIQE